MKRFFITLWMCLIFLPILVAADNDSPLYGSAVFKGGEYGSKYYRIPVLTVMPDGSLLAIADKRIEHNGDLPAKIDVVARRSTDNGHTWSDYFTVVENDSIGGCGDAAVVVDRVTGDVVMIFNRGGGFIKDPRPDIMITRSSDNGHTWSRPFSINRQIFTDLPSGDPGKINVTSAFATSGNAVQLDDGRILFALVTRRQGVREHKVYAVYSDDGGNTWNVSNTPASNDGDESKIVELPDGTLLMSVRNRYRSRKYDNRRLFSYSTDKGVTWNDDMTTVEHLVDPSCNGDIILYRRDGKEVLLHSLPHSLDKRENVTVFGSEDLGSSFPHRHKVSSGISAYSSLAVLPDGNIGILVEEAEEKIDAEGGQPYDINFYAIPQFWNSSAQE